MKRSILHLLLGRWRLGVTRPDSLGIVRDTAIRHSPIFSLCTGYQVLMTRTYPLDSPWPRNRRRYLIEKKRLVTLRFLLAAVFLLNLLVALYKFAAFSR